MLIPLLPSPYQQKKDPYLPKKNALPCVCVTHRAEITKRSSKSVNREANNKRRKNYNNNNENLSIQYKLFAFPRRLSLSFFLLRRPFLFWLTYTFHHLIQYILSYYNTNLYLLACITCASSFLWNFCTRSITPFPFLSIYLSTTWLLLSPQPFSSFAYLLLSAIHISCEKLFPIRFFFAFVRLSFLVACLLSAKCEAVLCFVKNMPAFALLSLGFNTQTGYIHIRKRFSVGKL